MNGSRLAHNNKKMTLFHKNQTKSDESKTESINLRKSQVKYCEAHLFRSCYGMTTCSPKMVHVVI